MYVWLCCIRVMELKKILVIYLASSRYNLTHYISDTVENHFELNFFLLYFLNQIYMSKFLP